jgi:hypothetical protein
MNAFSPLIFMEQYLNKPSTRGPILSGSRNRPPLFSVVFRLPAQRAGST